MMVQLNNPATIKDLKHGMFAIPKLQWSQEISDLGGYNFTVKNRVTSMRKNGYGDVLDANFNSDPTTPYQIEHVIYSKIDSFKKSKTKFSCILNEVFHLIQLWGGNANYLFYSRGVQEFKIDSYREYVDVIINDKKNLTEYLEATKTFDNNIRDTSIAFITKHSRFWQHAYGFKNPLPIYDSVMSLNCLGKNNQSYKDLLLYWTEMIRMANEIKEKEQLKDFSTIELERQLFLFFQQKNQNQWNRTNKNIDESNLLIKDNILFIAEQKYYFSILPDFSKNKKVGYIKRNGLLCASKELYQIIDDNSLNWLDTTVNDAGTKEKKKVQFKSFDACIKYLSRCFKIEQINSKSV